MIEQDLDRFTTVGAMAINGGDWEAYGDLFSEDLVMRTPSIPGVARGRDARVALVKDIMAAFPDGDVKIVRVFGQGDMGCFELRFTGTAAVPEGEEPPAEPKTVDLSYCIVMKFEDGRIVELNEYYDQLAM